MHSDSYRKILDDLVILIEKYSKPTIVEDLRLAVARVLQITGPQLICAISDSKKEELVPYVTRIFISSVQLLQDEVQEVRVETAKFAMLPRPADFVEYPSLHCNAGLQLLFMVFFESFTWSEVFLDFMLSYLIGDNSADKVIEEHIGTSSVHLFEQEDANIYAEHVITVQLANHHLQRLVSNGIGGIYFRKFTPSRLQRATHMLKVTVNAIESNSNKGHGLWGVLGVGKPFLAVYRVIVYSDLLLSVLREFDDWDQRVTDAAKELISTLRKFHKIPSVHPLLKDHYLYSSVEILQKAT
ncbi:uncharacterized protein [Ptychodera flava]|uniref:uncharacterized protein n=1 Tax=Ptychodera flava TaxID=63121 RepID=UPI00396A2EDA